jgi:hypothetical protein
MSAKKAIGKKSPKRQNGPAPWITVEKKANQTSYHFDIAEAPDANSYFISNWVHVEKKEYKEISILFGQIHPISKSLNYVCSIDLLTDAVKHWYRVDNFTNHAKSLDERLIELCTDYNIDLSVNFPDISEISPKDRDIQYTQDRATLAIGGYHGTEGELIFYRIPPRYISNKNQPIFQVYAEPVLRVLLHVRVLAKLVQAIGLAINGDVK